jgi:hypothetical protein
MIALLLYLLLQVYTPMGISPIVSGIKNLSRNTIARGRDRYGLEKNLNVSDL